MVKALPRYALKSLRKQFTPAQQGHAYLNHASMSPLPHITQQAMTHAIDEMTRLGAGFYPTAFEHMAHVRAQAAQLVNAHPENIALVSNTSLGMNHIAQGLPLEAGDEVLLCDVEFPSNVYPWLNLAEEGITTRIIEAVDGGLDVATLAENIRPETRVITVSGVQYFTGRHEELEEIGALCAAHDILLTVDAIQAAGVVPIDMQAMNIAAVVAGGQKALLGPPGQGFMAVRPDVLESMSMGYLGAASVVDYLDWLTYDPTPRPDATRFEMGTANLAGIYGLGASLELILSLGVEHIHAWVSHLSHIAVESLDALGLEVITPSQLANIVTFAYPKEDVMEAVHHLQERGIILREHMNAQGEPHIRISTHAYNTEEDVLRVSKGLEELL